MPSGEADYTDRLKDYVQVKDRIVALYELFGQARISTEYELTTAPDDKPKVICRAFVYRTPDDVHPSTGTSWLYLPGTTPYTRGSEIENAETSAIGRAIGFLGILIDKSIASANEIAGKQDDGPPPKAEPREGSLSGEVIAGKAPHDLMFRLAPDGTRSIGFSLKEGRQQVRVIAHADLAEQVSAFIEVLVGKRATVTGVMRDEVWTSGAKRIPYIALTASRITADGLDLPITDQTTNALGTDAAEQTPASSPQTPDEAPCNAKGPISGTICGLVKGHEGKHRELATDGRTIASW